MGVGRNSGSWFIVKTVHLLGRRARENMVLWVSNVDTRDLGNGIVVKGYSFSTLYWVWKWDFTCTGSCKPMKPILQNFPKLEIFIQLYILCLVTIPSSRAEVCLLLRRPFSPRSAVVSLMAPHFANSKPYIDPNILQSCRIYFLLESDHLNKMVTAQAIASDCLCSRGFLGLHP